MSKPSSSYPSVVPVGVDTTRASIARVYDAALNGKDNFDIDRAVLDQVRTVAPGVAELAWANRDFLIRACRFLARETGIDQYLDLGSGLPTAENTHQVVQRINPDSTVVYVDNDPMVLAHARALLAGHPKTDIVEADIFRPFEVMKNPEIRERIDFDRPVALFQIGTLHHYLGDDVDAMMGTYIDALPSGSYVAIAHFYDPEVPEYSELARAMEDKFVHSPMGSGRFRTRTQIKSLFGDLSIVEPGLVLCDNWWPDGPRLRSLSTVRNCIMGGVGMKR
ncbi:SAM-dependent methyltransferase [Nocardia sp. NPDC020380]|uniref:SAM-dependent methyltransferase n=1 Tax=Nocardia sp. NPDC020380 TaxID=3364309 RepID=UPI003787B0BA